MTIQEHLLTIVSEECVEVAHRVSKQLRFDGWEIQPGQEMTNRDRVMEEFYDLVAVIEKCQRMSILPEWDERKIQIHKELKNIKVENYLHHSKQNGTLSTRDKIEPDVTMTTTKIVDDIVPKTKYDHNQAASDILSMARAFDKAETEEERIKRLANTNLKLMNQVYKTDDDFKRNKIQAGTKEGGESTDRKDDQELPRRD